jgi:hypothetical protein
VLSTKEILDYVQGVKPVRQRGEFTLAEAQQIGDALGVRWGRFDTEQFRIGLNVELEHGRQYPETDITHDNPFMTGKIVLAHLNAVPRYYTILGSLRQILDYETMEKS